MSIQTDINGWADSVFGKASVSGTLNRIDQEIAGFFESPQREVADVAIMLYRFSSVIGIDLDEAIRQKMEINKSRHWDTAGDGHRQHAGSKPKAGLRTLLEDRDRRIGKLRETIVEMREAAQRMVIRGKSPAGDGGLLVEQKTTINAGLFQFAMMFWYGFALLSVMAWATLLNVWCVLAHRPYHVTKTGYAGRKFKFCEKCNIAFKRLRK